MSPCRTRRPVLLSKKATCLLVEDARRHVFLLSKDTCGLVEQVDMVCGGRAHVFLFSKNTCCCARRKYKCPCLTRTHSLLLSKDMCLLVQQQNMCSCSAGTHVFFNTLHDNVFVFRRYSKHTTYVGHHTWPCFVKQMGPSRLRTIAEMVQLGIRHWIRSGKLH